MTDRARLAPLYERLERKNIPALDGFRMVAVFLVIFFHFGFDAVPGGDGVMMFFVLSGFLITWLLIKEHERTGAISFRAFYRRRTLRIFPAFYGFWLLIVGAGLVLHGAGPSAHAWSAFFYVSNYYSALTGHPVSAFSHTWSLAIEEQFYLLWPLVFVCCRGSLPLLTRVLVTLIASVALNRLVLVFVFAVDGSYLYSALDTRVDQLLIGCLTAVLLRRRALEWLWSRVCCHPVAPLVTVSLLVGSVAFGEQVLWRYRDVAGYTVHAVLYAVLIVQLVALSDSPLWSWLNSAPARFLGLISYPLYLYQEVTLYSVREALQQQPVIVQLLAAIAVTVGVASMSYYVIERPFLRMKHRATATGGSAGPSMSVAQTGGVGAD
jgi:peptidoglycan/LPS O-acetylase OafA/YrhL